MKRKMQINHSCYYCQEALSYSQGFKGKNADLNKLLFVLHRSDSREPQPSSPLNYKTALLNSQTGKILTEILDFCNLSIEDVYLTNLFKCLLPKDREPRKKEYQACVKVLEEQISYFSPKKIISFGDKTYKYMFPEIAKQKSYNNMVLQTLNFKSTATLISYHPAWIWSFKTEKRKEHYKKIKDFLN